MFPSLSILDDFLPPGRCEEIRQQVLDDGFTTVYHEDPPVPYPNVNMSVSAPEVAEGLSKALGAKIAIKIQAFRLGFKDSHLHNLVHADHLESYWAGVLFLNPTEQSQGGTAFWRHKKHGWDAMPTQDQLDAAGYTLKELGADWHRSGAWEMVSLAGMKENRMIIYPSQMFHSRWPWQGWGEQDKPETGRLVHCSFFDVL